MQHSFSQRAGFKPISEFLQDSSMDDALRNGLWNVFYISIWEMLPISPTVIIGRTLISDWGETFLRELFCNLFNSQVDTISYAPKRALESIKSHFFQAPWYEVYDFIEFIVNSSTIDSQIVHDFATSCNTVLVKNKAAYSIIDGVVVKITNNDEIAAIKEAVESPYEFANQHLHEALAKLSDRDNPDYRNSIKESITAVDAICTSLTGTSTLGQALNKLESKLDFNKQFKQGLEKLYSYTNGGSGIRHPLTEEGHHPTFDEAKFMLVACSAFVNYLKSKASILND